MNPKVFLGMSGGVDSSVSAILLKQQGYDVTGVYMKNWSQDLPGMKCPWAEDLADAKRVAVQLDLDFEVWDFESDYKSKVVDYMLSEFQKGRTPNPDVICNEQVKFKLFYERAMARGADFIATGHYARVGFQDARGVHAYDGDQKRTPHPDSASVLLRAIDDNKDQTYFLYRMSDQATAHTIFPIGDLTKPEVKRIAAEHGLDVATKKESMGICFVGEVGMKDFLKEYLNAKPGEIREIETGQVIGYHDGAIYYTIGQRHGLYLGGGLPYYVVAKDLHQNLVYVSRDLNRPNLWADRLKLEDLHLRNNLSLADLSKLDNLAVRLRHRAPLILTSINLEKESEGINEHPLKTAKNESNLVEQHNGKSSNVKGAVVNLSFSSPIKRPASGQSAVLYSSEVCLGGGIIGE